MTLKKSIILSFISLSVNSWSSTAYDDRDFYTISEIQVKEISRDVILDTEVQRTVNKIYMDNSTAKSQLDVAGQVIKTGRDLVALGEDIYRLVSKGKPNVTTAYDPISVIPKVDGKAVDILETEGWSMPRKLSYTIVFKNLYQIDVITFRYSIIYSYRGSYNGKGAYITGAQIQPDYVNVLWGFDFNATMKLGGIQNQGTRNNPVAGATLLMQYSASNVLNSRTMVDTYFITGRGAFRKL